MAFIAPVSFQSLCCSDLNVFFFFPSFLPDIYFCFQPPHTSNSTYFLIYSTIVPGCHHLKAVHVLILSLWSAPHTLFLQTTCLVCTVSPTAALPMRPTPSEINPAPSSSHPAPFDPSQHFMGWDCEEFNLRTFLFLGFC